MGNSTKSFNKNFLNDWVQIERQQTPQFDRVIWGKMNDRSIQMQEYTLNVTSKEQLQEEERIHTMRQNHPQLVSSLHFKDQSEEQFCASNYKGRIYIERIPVTLQSITDVPFPDALHIYLQSLQGFHALTNQMQSGCFPISQQHIGINCDSVCKVWMNSKFNRNYPSRNQRITEERMVRNVLDTIEENVDLGSLHNVPSPTQYIYTKARMPAEVKFGEAINLLRNYANQFFAGVIPQKLSCVDKVGGAFLLSKNWEGQRTETLEATRGQVNGHHNGHYNGHHNGVHETQQHHPQYHHTQHHPQHHQHFQSATVPVQGTSVYRPADTVHSDNYTAFRREQPVHRQSPVTQPQLLYGQGQGQTSQAVEPNITTPNFHHETMQSSQLNSSRTGYAQQMNGSIYVPQENRSGFQQVTYRSGGVNMGNGLNEVKRSQFGPQVSFQRPQGPIIQQIVHGSQVSGLHSSVAHGSQVSSSPQVYPHQQQVPLTNNLNGSHFLLANTHPQAHQGLLTNNRIQQVTSQKGIILQSFSSSHSHSHSPFARIQQHPITIQNQLPVIPSHQTVPTKKSTTIFSNSDHLTQPQQTTGESSVITSKIQQPFGGGNMTQQPTMIRNSQLQKVNSKLVFIEKSSSGSGRRQSFEQQRQVVPAMTTPQMTTDYNDHSPSQQQHHQQTNYYDFTSKLYDNESPMKKSPVDYTSKLDFTKKIQSPTKTGKYNLNLDDGMSSMDFLNSLKTMNVKPIGEKEYHFTAGGMGNKYNSYGDNNFNVDSYVGDYKGNKFEGKDTYGNVKDELSYSNNRDPSPVMTKPAAYTVAYEQYSTVLPVTSTTSDNDLIVVGSKIDLTPLRVYNQQHNNSGNKITYEQQSGTTLSGNVHYEQETLHVQNDVEEIYEEQYYEERTYQSVFDKYASGAKNGGYGQQPQQQQRLGENIDTQYTIHNLDEYGNGQYGRQYAGEEEYKVDFDPEILADLERLKGGN